MMPLILFIDMIDQRAGCGLRYSEVNHMMAGPREFVSSFIGEVLVAVSKIGTIERQHTKQILCNGCKKVADVKDVFECECECRIYCSRECAKLDWAKHKRECVAYQK